ncbi:MAG: sugar ABC transporter ATP-binding protein [Hyphomicrobiales bacterium]
MTNADPLLAVDELCLSYGRVNAVRNASFSVGKGEIVGLCGHNGAGKSSIVRMLSGLVAPDAGNIALNGEPCRFRNVHDAQSRGIALVDQEISIIPALTVAENLALGEPGLGFFERLPETQIRERLSAVGLAEVKASTYLEDLSIGHRQLVEIARALGRKAQLFILDEPTATLNAADIETVFAAVRRVAARGCGVIYVSHRLDEVLALCHRVIVMRDGAIVADTPIAGLTGDDLVTLMLGHHTVAEAAAPSTSKGTNRLTIHNLAAGPVLRRFSLAAEGGRVLGIAGQVGSGASEILRAAAGMMPDARGRIFINRDEVRLGDPQYALRCGIGYATADRKGEGLFLSRNIAENLVATRLDALTKHGVLTLPRLFSAARKIAQVVGVDAGRLRETVSRLSGGNQQKVFLGRGLERTDMRVLLLDEPTRGVDVGGRAEIHAIIRKAAANGAIIVFASSDLDEVLGLADDIVVMRGGRKVSHRKRAETDHARLLSDMTHSAHQSHAA